MEIKDLKTLQDCKSLLEWYNDLIDRSKMPKMEAVYRDKIKQIRKKEEELRRINSNQ